MQGHNWDVKTTRIRSRRKGSYFFNCLDVVVGIELLDVRVESAIVGRQHHTPGRSIRSNGFRVTVTKKSDDLPRKISRELHRSVQEEGVFIRIELHSLHL